MLGRQVRLPFDPFHAPIVLIRNILLIKIISMRATNGGCHDDDDDDDYEDVAEKKAHLGHFFSIPS